MVGRYNLYTAILILSGRRRQGRGTRRRQGQSQSRGAARTRLQLLVFWTLVALAVTGVGLSAGGVEQTHSGTSCDDSCHRGRHREVYEGLLIVEEVAFPAEIRVGDEVQVQVEFWSEVNVQEASRLREVEVTLSLENGTFEVDQATRTTYNLDRGQGNGRTLEWTLTAQQEGNDTILVHLDGYNTHERGFNILTNARQPVRTLPMLPDAVLESEGVVLDPALPIRGQGVRMRVEVGNLGAAATANLSLYLGQAAPERLLARAGGLVLEKQASQMVRLNFDTQNLSGQPTLVLIVEEVLPAERNPDNQRLEFQITVGEPGNLWVEQVTNNPLQPWFSENMEVTVVVGNTAAYPVATDLLVKMTNPFGNQSREEVMEVTIGAEGLTPIVFDWKLDLPYSTPGNSSLEVEIDPLLIIPETNETDNARTIPVTINPWVPVVELQLRQQEVSFTPELLVEGLPVNINLTLANLGREVARSDLAAWLTPEGGSPFLLATRPVAIEPGGAVELHLPWNTWHWEGEVQLVLEVDELEQEETYANNRLVFNLTVLPPPRLIFHKPLFEVEPANVSWLFPVKLTVPVGELNGTPVEGQMWLELPDATRTRVAFAFEGGEYQWLDLTFTPLPGEGSYRLYLEAHGTTDELNFELVGRDPREFLDLGPLTISPQPPRAEGPMTLMVDVEWGLAQPALLRMGGRLVAVGGEEVLLLPQRNLTLLPGHNTLAWTLLVGPGNYNLAVEGSLVPDSFNLSLAPLNFTVAVEGEEVPPESIPGPGLTMVAGVLAVAAGLRWWRGVGKR